MGLLTKIVADVKNAEKFVVSKAETVVEDAYTIMDSISPTMAAELAPYAKSIEQAFLTDAGAIASQTFNDLKSAIVRAVIAAGPAILVDPSSAIFSIAGTVMASIPGTLVADEQIAIHGLVAAQVSKAVSTLLAGGTVAAPAATPAAHAATK